eukprot:3101583-Heterocapsa_arctica.AAC.1
MSSGFGTPAAAAISASSKDLLPFHGPFSASCGSRWPPQAAWISSGALANIARSAASSSDARRVHFSRAR